MAGCGVEEEPQLGVTTSAVIRCPDPEDCAVGNGGGTYTEEHGFAGIGPNAFMITRFVNPPTTTGAVTIEGRYNVPNSPNFATATGTIEYVMYGGFTWTPVQVSESFTTPTWQLSRVKQDGTTVPASVVGADIVNMQLVVELMDESDIKRYTLQFSGYTSESMSATIREVNMMWKNTDAPDPFTQYCFRAPGAPGNGAPDVVVFQQNIYVNAINAKVPTRDDAYVTFSCRYGAPATVRLWGYAYRTQAGIDDTWLFDAALHMKRASYCGDDSFYTKTGTDIIINDTHVPPIRTDPNLTLQNLEAEWTPAGARCVNMANRRRPNIQYAGDTFHLSDCGLLECVTTLAQTDLGRLADEPAP
jgi:hypothetical protein